MKKYFFFFLVLIAVQSVTAQKPCNRPEFRQFDFRVGEWEAFDTKGNKAGDNKISIIPDSCVIPEEWKSAGEQQGLIYTGKSFNSYNAATKQWRQNPDG